MLANNLEVMQGGLDTEEQIRERLKEHKDDKRREIVYGLRLLAADFLDISGGAVNIRKEGKFADVEKQNWEEGRSSSIRVNTHLQTKALVINEPDMRWENCKAEAEEDQNLTAVIREAYFLYLWRTQRLSDAYRQKLLDMLISGEANIAAWRTEAGFSVEYVDSLDVTWDGAYKEPDKRRHVFVDKHLPMVDALRFYPNLANLVNQLGKGLAGGEKPVTVTCYYSKSTYAVMYGKEFVVQPTANDLGRIPLRVTELFREQSVKHPTGMVELQIGTHSLMLRFQRMFREIAIRSVPLGVAAGDWDERAMRRVEDGEEGVILRAKSPSATFKWETGGDLQPAAVTLFEMLKQQQNAESGTNDFQKNQTDTKVDFASQLALIAQQSGVLAKYAAQQHEDGIREDAAMVMEMAALIEGPLELTVEGHQIKFDAFNPINPILGKDGDIVMKPGGMEYKSPGQKLQEQMVLVQALALAVQLPPGLREPQIADIFKAYGVEDGKARVEAMQQAEQMAMMQQMMMAQTAQAQPQSGPPQANQKTRQGPGLASA